MHFWNGTENLEVSLKFLELANSTNIEIFSMFQRKSPNKPSVHCTTPWSGARTAKRWPGPRILTSSSHVIDVALNLWASQKVGSSVWSATQICHVERWIIKDLACFMKGNTFPTWKQTSNKYVWEAATLISSFFPHLNELPRLSR